MLVNKTNVTLEIFIFLLLNFLLSFLTSFLLPKIQNRMTMMLDVYTAVLDVMRTLCLSKRHSS